MRRLHDEFPDISISKIRYLEDEGLLMPRRTQGGYRLFSESDLERLQTILRLQRDEFLPLRVIKDELDAPGAKERKRRRPAALGAAEESITLDELCERAVIDPSLAKELEDFGLLAPHGSGAEKRYPGVRRRRRAALRPARALRRGPAAPPHDSHGHGARRPRCSSSCSRRRCSGRNSERRAQAVRDLQQLAELAGELSSLLYWRDLRDLAQ